MKYNPDIHKRQSIRLKEYDYSCNGAYFITICTFKKECLFGDIDNGKMFLNQNGNIAYEECIQTEKIRQEINLDEFIIMPNHIHGIIFIDQTDNTKNMGERRSPLRMRPKSLSSFISGYKSATFKKINTIRNTSSLPVWQRNYYEHIIRDENELYAIRQYIHENPLKWEMDKENPLNNTVGANGVRPLKNGDYSCPSNNTKNLGECHSPLHKRSKP